MLSSNTMDIFKEALVGGTLACGHEGEMRKILGFEGDDLLYHGESGIRHIHYSEFAHCRSLFFNEKPILLTPGTSPPIETILMISLFFIVIVYLLDYLMKLLRVELTIS